FRLARRPRLLLEPLESRRMLSAASPSVTNPSPASTALTPSEIAAAYSISLASTTGSGQTIAIVDAYNDPNIKADLATFDSQYNLPVASLTVLNQYGQTTNL